MEYSKTGRDEAQSQQQKVELKKILEATLKKEGSPVELGDVSKWEKIDPMTLLVAKKLNLDLNESYLPLLRDNPETGIYTLIVGKYYQRKAEDDGLKDVAQSIEALLQKEGTNIEQLMVYALHTFKDIPDIKKILGNISEAKKTVKAIQKLEDRIIEEEKGVTKSEVFLEIVKSGTKKIGKATGKIIGKTIAYPILGNLPYDLQEKLEQKVGREYYNASSAAKTSSVIAGGIIPGLAFFTFSPPNEDYSDKVFVSTVIGGVSWLVDRLIRSVITDVRNRERLSSGHPLVEIAALPFKLSYSLYKKSARGLNNFYEEAKSEAEKKKKWQKY
ncbi:hypothetical protein HY643_02030 [Candidatus Woesearchaeota archaeon]|nr:hypothetical protein [Candidatus Woesearchaeota archaeon]